MTPIALNRMAALHTHFAAGTIYFVGVMTLALAIRVRQVAARAPSEGLIHVVPFFNTQHKQSFLRYAFCKTFICNVIELFARAGTGLFAVGTAWP